MRKSKSVLLLLVAIGLIGTWAYHLYDKKDYSSQTVIIYVKDSTDVLQATRDSLRGVFVAALSNLPESLESLRYHSRSNTDNNGNDIDKINALNNEINTLLQNEPLTNAGMLLASQKIGQLKAESAHFQINDQDLETERERLKALYREMSDDLDRYQKRSRDTEDK